ncbi:MAG TPA: YeeE/YedE thiosulfate transporter family protein [Quisquiliibacterium sp.]|nr:MAG: transporter [Burkholderiaceae bacterium]HPA88598.1 YeeE/YedE thiosulfate transporter family protein [Quisquiliibacterium sp.]HQD82248.1 YeeE/YedE thiosulfate transporter family protein [Quisquiliibacterium sp.]HQN11889.1 YeeE/YedE thiosulfate transporter family protein [Quisquiliibacterium sp.]HQP68395.1 YeeE/YedE thiosulfate transporter family protein [Quisquiliibacterium sp.]
MFPLDDAGLWSGLVCGALFGFVLERAGFGSPCKLTGQFRLTDWSVLKVMFTAIVVAAAGLWALRLAGVVAEGAVYVPTSFLAAAAIGGVLVGIGFAVGGYCPGTSVVGLFSGRLDAAVFLVGLVLGTVVFAGLYGPAIEAVMGAWEVDAGDTFSEAWGVSDGLVLAVMAAALVGVFVLGGRLERASRGPVSADEAVAGADAATTRTAFPNDAPGANAH